MCGRFTLYDLSKFKININFEFKPNFNISPGSNVLILNEKKIPTIINWGITANWSQKVKIFNSLEAISCRFIPEKWGRYSLGVICFDIW